RRPDVEDRRPDVEDRRPDVEDRRPDVEDRRPDVEDRRPDIGGPAVERVSVAAGTRGAAATVDAHGVRFYVPVRRQDRCP
ncbi:hypothetical protein AB0465_25580, partial [Streptomyces griseoviridis]|uniref:hypothetical protein n=1 Tax=Streptomyces griseoviridis TaxID=45398 RepID=UPI00344E2231